MNLRHAFSALMAATMMAACSSPTSPNNIRAHEAVWKSHAIVNYDYTYQFDGGNSAGPRGPVRIQVRQDTVRIVMQLSDSAVLSPTYWPTVNALFTNALSAAADGSLADITFDPAFDYPTSIRYVPMPDRPTGSTARDLEAK